MLKVFPLVFVVYSASEVVLLILSSEFCCCVGPGRVWGWIGACGGEVKGVRVV